MRLLILFSLLSCALACSWGCWGCCCVRPPLYPFLRGASRDARIAFRKIINDTSLTRNELEEKLKEWAEEYGVKDSYDRFAKRTEEQKKQTQDDIKKAMENLTKFFEDLADIENDKSLTIAQAKRKTRELYDTLNRRTTKAARCVAGAFAPELQCDDGWYGGYSGGRWYGRAHGGLYARPAKKQKSPASSDFSSFMESAGLGYPWYSGSYRLQ